jgi:rhamnose transport system ATP-binding protein
MAQQSPLIQVLNIHKAYGGVQALAGVSLDIAPGEVHALCGENGAGKSTLIKVLAGSVAPDSGKILIDGNAMRTGDVRASEQAGIAVIHQESVAFPHLSSFDNIFVGREPKRLGGLFLDRAKMRRQTRDLLARLGEAQAFDPSRAVGELSVAQRQMVGMARALSQDCRLLIMDEPTASLSERETRVLFNLIRQFRAQGVSVLYVSHRLDEIFELCDRVTVFRDGQFVATSPIDQITKEKLIQLMVGRDLDAASRVGTAHHPDSPHDEAGGAHPTDSEEVGIAHPAREPRLQVRNLTRQNVFSNVSFDVHAGEIVGMSGLVGAGRSEVARVIFGVDARNSGEVRVDGSALRGNSVREAMDRGFAMVPEDRQHLGLVLPMSVGANLSLAVLRRLTTAGLTSQRRERELVEQLMKDLGVKAAGSAVPAQTLSGGNQQKLVIGKWLATRPRVLILDEPTRGVDVGAKAEVHKLIRKLADEGMATLLISSDLPEVLAMSDRILVMRAGRIAGEVPRSEATQERVLSLAIPATATEGAAA